MSPFMLGALDQLVGAVVDDDVPRLHLRVVGSDAFEHPLQRPLRELHDVGLGRAGDLGASLAPGVLEREPRDLLAPFLADDLEGLGDPGCLQVLDPCVQVLDVLPNHDEVDPAAAVGRRDAGHLPDRPDVGVRLEELSERDVRGLLAETDRGLQRPLQGDARPRDRLDRLRRHPRRQAFLEHLGAGLGLLPRDRDAGGLDDPPGRVHALGPDPVAGDERDDGGGVGWVRAHESSLAGPAAILAPHPLTSV
jgi:hypothetical protein